MARNSDIWPEIWKFGPKYGNLAPNRSNRDAVSERTCLVLILHLFSLQFVYIFFFIVFIFEFVLSISCQNFKNFPPKYSLKKRNMEALEGNALNSYFVERRKKLGEQIMKFEVFPPKQRQHQSKMLKLMLGHEFKA